ncbi:Ankyrin repeat-containing protein [Brazilian cedratvirus IHUMI]|uniref:Ankyrin repeat-containing protein n=1 Tax=Brazilian cedratvirus IHUMI TaxID=2126980 RepID=A0A2R8FDJ6_9VIRU|nr:Ankyrin repeat-containing protein [Brazilian cedratvirus IHUMI]
MEIQKMPEEMLGEICSYLGGYSYVASLVPYLRSCVEEVNKDDFLLEVYEKQDRVLIYKYGLFPNYRMVERCVSIAVKKENMTLLSWLFEKSQGKLVQMIAKQATVHGSYKVFTWAHERGCSITKKMFYRAAESDNSKLYRFMKSKQEPSSVQGCANMALYAGKFRILPAILEDLEDLDISYELGVTGSRGLIKSFSRFHDLDPNLLLSGACLHLHKELVLWLKNKYEITDLLSEDQLPLLKGFYAFLTENKSEEEKLDFLKFLDENFTVDYYEATYELSSTNHMSILRWCLTKTTDISTAVFNIACRNTVEDMEYLYNLGHFRNNVEYYESAVYAGKPENLTWLESKGLTISSFPPVNLGRYRKPSQVIEGAIIPCFQWLSERGVKILSGTLHESSAANDMKTFIWLLDNVKVLDSNVLCTVICRGKKFNLQAFSALLPFVDKEKASALLKQKTCTNYLLLEEAKRRLLVC